MYYHILCIYYAYIRKYIMHILCICLEMFYHCYAPSLREKCPNADFFLVPIGTLFTQCLFVIIIPTCYNTCLDL